MRSTGAPFEPFDISTLPNQEGRRMFGESTNDEMSQSGEAGDEGWQTSGYSEETLLANLNREVSRMPCSPSPLYLQHTQLHLGRCELFTMNSTFVTF